MEERSLLLGRRLQRFDGAGMSDPIAYYSTAKRQLAEVLGATEELL